MILLKSETMNRPATAFFTQLDGRELILTADHAVGPVRTQEFSIHTPQREREVRMELTRVDDMLSAAEDDVAIHEAEGGPIRPISYGLPLGISAITMGQEVAIVSFPAGFDSRTRAWLKHRRSYP